METTHKGAALLPGTLDMLILKTVLEGPLHGYGIALQIRELSENVLQVGEGSLYPALQRLVRNGCLAAEWGVSGNHRRARYYKLTPAGRKRLKTEMDEFGRMIGAIARVMQMV